MNKNEFIVLTDYYSGDARYVNINHISYYFKSDKGTKINLLSEKWLYVRETCDMIDDMINEVISK